jgi:cytochrome b
LPIEKNTVPLPLENNERRKSRDPEILVWSGLIRIGHWLLAFAFATLYLEYKKFPLHPYAGYVVLIIVVLRIVWGFIGPGAANFSTFFFTPKQVFEYLKNSLRGHAAYYFSHNPMGAAMVYALLTLLLTTSTLGLLSYSASQQLGPFGKLIPGDWEDILIISHTWLGHLTAALVIGHLFGVLWASRLHRENYVLAMLRGIRRIPRSISVPQSILLPMKRRNNGGPRTQKVLTWLNYRRPFLGSIILLTLIIGVITLPLIQVLVDLNKFIPAY